HQVNVTAQDAVGRTVSDSWSVKLDRTRPTANTPTGSLYAPGKWIQDGAKTLHVDASDATSGVRRVELRVDNTLVDSKSATCSPKIGRASGRERSWTPASATTEGAHAIKVTVVDDAGNSRDLTAWTIYVDKFSPTFG